MYEYLYKRWMQKSDGLDRYAEAHGEKPVNIQAELDKLASEKWEMVGCYIGENGIEIYAFRRKVKE